LNLTVGAKAYWQTHTREFMEFLRDNDTSTLRPEGPPSRFELNYPLVPFYLDLIPAVDQTITANNLRRNWGGVAYAAWLLTGKGAPYLVAADSTAVTAAPLTPANLATSLITDPATGLTDPFTIKVTWDTAANADGYILEVCYGKNAGVTADWDRLALAQPQGGGQLTFLHQALNVAKTYQYRVSAFNGKGVSAASAPVTQRTPWDLPGAPEFLTFVSSTPTTVTLSWYNSADNATGFIIQRADVPPAGSGIDFVEIARTADNPPWGGYSWTDTTAAPGVNYNYRVAAYNASGPSTWGLPVTTNR
jgi:hypothetical protein